MKMKPRGKKTTPAKDTASSHQKKPLRAEWPLLVYPVLVVAALVALYGINRSILNEVAPVSEPQAARPPESQTNQVNGQNTATVPSDATATEIGTMQNQGLPGDEPSQTSAQNAGQDQVKPADDNAQSLPGVAGVLARLRQATQTGDDALIKQCMDELMAMGDDAAGALSEIIISGDDATALWAAKALARMGTPVASSVLLDTLAQVQDGEYKGQLVKEASNITNHDSWPLLLDTIQDATDGAVLRAASASLAKMADKPVVDEIVARYDAAATEEEANRLAQMLSNIDSPAAGEALRALAGSVSAAPQDALEKAAVNALANVADTQSVNYLLRRLEATPAGEGGYLFNAIANISQPQAEAALQYAAAGSKEVSAEQGRTAAICALQNFPTERTYALLEQIVATSDNASIVSAAARTLANISNAEPVVAVNASTKVSEIPLLPSDPLQK